MNIINNQYYIREAAEADTDATVKIVNNAYWNQQKIYLDAGDQSLRTSASEVANLLYSRTNKLFLAVHKETDSIAGLILYDHTNKVKSASFGLFAIDAVHQGKQLGNHLVKFVEEYAERRGKAKIKIEVLGFAKRLQGYYETLGYKKTGTSHRFSDVSQAKLKSEYVNSPDACYVVMKKTIVSLVPNIATVPLLDQEMASVSAS